MDKNVRSKLKQEIGLFLRKYPGANTSKVKNFIKSDENQIDISDIRPGTLNKFIRTNIQKFNEVGDWVKHRGGNGRKQSETNKRVTLKVKKKLVKKPNSSLRKVAKAVGISCTSFLYIFTKNLGCKPYHKYTVQKMSKDHKKRRVSFAEYCLEEYGESTGPYSVQSRVVNSDFNAYIRIT
mgnify:FL=1